MAISVYDASWINRVIKIATYIPLLMSLLVISIIFLYRKMKKKDIPDKIQEDDTLLCFKNDEMAEMYNKKCEYEVEKREAERIVQECNKSCDEIINKLETFNKDLINKINELKYNTNCLVRQK